MNTIRTQIRVDNLVSGTIAHSGIPVQTVSVSTVSGLTSQLIQVVGVAHAAINTGGVTADAMIVISNRSSTATIQVGKDDASAFAPSGITIPPGSPPAILPFVATPADVYLLSSEAGAEVLVTAYKIEAAP